jgi:catechol 2,3-dioxygenase-like lactoylglutathione lyase family enzyme
VSASKAARVLAVHPVLMARDVVESVRFYESLGFRESFRDAPASPRYAGVRRDGIELHLQWHDAADIDGPGDRPVYRFLVEHVDALLAEVTRRTSGLDRTDVMDTAWGTREFHVRDPARNGLQFYRLR